MSLINPASKQSWNSNHNNYWRWSVVTNERRINVKSEAVLTSVRLANTQLHLIESVKKMYFFSFMALQYACD
jgi:hypothetical protein